MRRVSYRKVVRETRHNHNLIRRLYYSYIHQSMIDRVLELLVVFAMIFTVLEIVLDLFIPVPESVGHLIHSFSTVVLFIFALELIREYAHSANFRHFVKRNWLDLSLVLILSLHMFGASYFGFAKFEKLTKFKNLIKETKHYRIALKFFGVMN